MPYPNWWAARVKSPGLFKWMRTKVLSPSIQMIHGQLKNPPAGQTGSVTQAYRFNIKEFQTRKQVTDWLKEHKVSYMFIEAPAKEVKKMSELQELVTTGIVDKILSEFNPNHDDRGRFSGGSGGGGGGSAKAAPGATPYRISKEGGQYVVPMKDGTKMNRQQLCTAMNKEGRYNPLTNKALFTYKPTGTTTMISVKATSGTSKARSVDMGSVARSLDNNRATRIRTNSGIARNRAPANPFQSGPRGINYRSSAGRAEARSIRGR